MKKWDKHLLQLLEKESAITVFRDPTRLKEVSCDFGHLIHGTCCGVAVLKTVNEVQQLMLFANKWQVPITLRGLGLSQSGQAVPVSGAVVLDLSQLKISHEMKAQQIKFSAGATWRSLLEVTLPQGLVPLVFPHNINLTIAGILSVGGVGAASHRYGFIADHVLELEVVTGAGELKRCSREIAADLFYAILGGLGRVAVIVSVVLSLRKIKTYIRTYYLLYLDHEKWLQDQKILCGNKVADYLEGFCSASIQGTRYTEKGRRAFAQWLYPLQISFEYEVGEQENFSEKLSGLQHWKLTYVEDFLTAAYIDRHEIRFATMRNTGAWNLSHPWFECFLPMEKMPSLLPQLLACAPLFLGDGHRLMFVANQEVQDSLLMRPEGQFAALFAVLPLGILPYAQQEALEAIQTLHDLSLQQGGKRYLSGWLGTMKAAQWQQHYAHKYQAWLAVKHKYDPNHILCSALLMAEESLAKVRELEFH